MQLMTFLWRFLLSHENVLIGGFCASVFAGQLKRFRDFGLISMWTAKICRWLWEYGNLLVAQPRLEISKIADGGVRVVQMGNQ